MGRVVLVTGANGFAGRWVTASLKKDPCITVIATDVQENPVVLDNQTSPADVYLPGDLSNRAFTQSLHAVNRFDVIVHLAGVLAKDDAVETHAAIMDANVAGLFRILEIARIHGSQLIFPSTGLVYGDQTAPYTEEMQPRPADFYALSKSIGESMITYYSGKYGFPAVIFRPSVMYGPGQHGSMFIPSLVAALLAGREFPMTPGEQTRDFLCVTDFVEAVGTVIRTPAFEGIYNLGSGQPYTLRAVADLAAEIVGAPGLVRIGAIPYRSRESWAYSLDISRMTTHTNWRPRVDLKAGLTAVVRHERSEAR